MAELVSGALVLLADDEAGVRDVLSETLDEAGYGVLEAADGHAGLVELERVGSELIALVTDIRVGAGPNGWDLARRARELNPGIAVVYVSGDSADDWHALGVPHSAILQKPFPGSQLVVALATQLNKTDA